MCGVVQRSNNKFRRYFDLAAQLFQVKSTGEVVLSNNEYRGFVVCGQILRLHVGCFSGHLVCLNSRLSWTPWAILQTVVDSRQMLKYRKELGLCISRESSSLDEYHTTILLKCISHRMLLSERTCDCPLLDCSTLLLCLNAVLYKCRVVLYCSTRVLYCTVLVSRSTLLLYYTALDYCSTLFL